MLISWIFKMHMSNVIFAVFFACFLIVLACSFHTEMVEINPGIPAMVPDVLTSFASRDELLESILASSNVWLVVSLQPWRSVRGAMCSDGVNPYSLYCFFDYLSPTQKWWNHLGTCGTELTRWEWKETCKRNNWCARDLRCTIFNKHHFF